MLSPCTTFIAEAREWWCFYKQDLKKKKESKKDKIYGYLHGPGGTQAAVFSDILIFNVKAIEVPDCPFGNLN